MQSETIKLDLRQISGSPISEIREPKAGQDSKRYEPSNPLIKDYLASSGLQ